MTKGRTDASKRAIICEWYVLALLECKDVAIWNPLNLDQWRFYLVPRSTFEKHGTKSVGVGALDAFVREGEAHLMGAAELRARGREVMRLDLQGTVVLGVELTEAGT
jgi:hypothetical protein